MNRMLTCLIVLAGFAFAGCEGGGFEYTEADDSIKAIQHARDTQGAPLPTEMPPGLGEDLPSKNVRILTPIK